MLEKANEKKVLLEKANEKKVLLEIANEKKVSLEIANGKKFLLEIAYENWIKSNKLFELIIKMWDALPVIENVFFFLIQTNYISMGAFAFVTPQLHLTKARNVASHFCREIISELLNSLKKQ